MLLLYHKSCYIQILQLSFVLPLVGVCCSGYEGPILSFAYSIDGHTKVVYAAAFTSFGQECILKTPPKKHSIIILFIHVHFKEREDIVSLQYK
jgi:hypothetical protein